MATKLPASTPVRHESISAGKQVATRAGKPWQLDDEVQLAAADGAIDNVPAPITEATPTSSESTAAAISAVEGSAAIDTAATTPATEAAGTSASISPWAIGGGVLGVAAIAAIASGGSDSKNSSTIAQGDKDKDTGSVTPPAETTPDTTQPGTTAPNTTPPDTQPDAGTPTPQPGTPAQPQAHSVTVAHDNALNTLDKSLFGHSTTNTQQIRIDRIEAAEGSDLDARIHYDYKVTQNGVDVEKHSAYEVIKVGGDGITWEQARAHAESLGGHLLVINDGAEAEFLARNLSSRLGDTPSDFAGLSSGSWVGLSQDASATAANTGWHWDVSSGRADFTPTDWNNFGAELAGHGKLPSDGAASTSNVEAHKADHGAIIAAWQPPTGNSKDGSFAKTMLFDHGGKLNSFVIEYDDYQSPLKQSSTGGTPAAIVEGQIIHASDFDSIRWDSILNNGGKITYTAVDGTEAGSAKPVEGARQVTLTITEQPAASNATGFGHASALKALLDGSTEEQHLLLS